VHAAVARALEERGHGQGEQAALLAHHWEEAREPLLAARWHRRAAEWSGFTNVEHTFYHWGRVRALVRGLTPSPERDELATTAGLRLLWVGARLGTLGEDAEALVNEVTEAAQRVGSEMAVAEARSVYAFHRLFTNGSPTEVVADLEWACEVLSRGDNMDAWLQATFGLAATYLGAGRYEHAVQLADTALARCQNDPSGYSAALGFSSTILYFLFNKAAALARLGRLDEAEMAIDALVSIAAADGTPVTQAMAEHGETTRAAMRGNAAAEVQHAIRGLDLTERLGLPSSIALSAAFLGVARCQEQNWSAGIPMLERASALHQERLFRTVEVLTLAYLAQARLGAGDVPGARAAADEALALAAQRGLWMGAVEAWVARARVRMHESGSANSAIEQDLAAADALVMQTGEGCPRHSSSSHAPS
jgi:adenylate cyclase